MLILSHSYRARVYLDKLCERILKSACDGDRAALSNVEIGKFLRAELGSRVNRGSCLADDDIAASAAYLAQRVRDECLALARCGPVADGDSAYTVCLLYTSPSPRDW